MYVPVEQKIKTRYFLFAPISGGCIMNTLSQLHPRCWRSFAMYFLERELIVRQPWLFYVYVYICANLEADSQIGEQLIKDEFYFSRYVSITRSFCTIIRTISIFFKIIFLTFTYFRTILKVEKKIFFIIRILVLLISITY